MFAEVFFSLVVLFVTLNYIFVFFSLWFFSISYFFFSNFNFSKHEFYFEINQKKNPKWEEKRSSKKAYDCCWFRSGKEFNWTFENVLKMDYLVAELIEKEFRWLALDCLLELEQMIFFGFSYSIIQVKWFLAACFFLVAVWIFELLYYFRCCFAVLLGDVRIFNFWELIKKRKRAIVFAIVICWSGFFQKFWIMCCLL